MPNGVGTGSPPAKFLPPRTVWQSLQLPIAANSRPRLIKSGAEPHYYDLAMRDVVPFERDGRLAADDFFP